MAIVKTSDVGIRVNQLSLGMWRELGIEKPSRFSLWDYLEGLDRSVEALGLRGVAVASMRFLPDAAVVIVWELRLPYDEARRFESLSDGQKERFLLPLDKPLEFSEKIVSLNTERNTPPWERLTISGTDSSQSYLSRPTDLLLQSEAEAAIAAYRSRLEELVSSL